MSVVIILLGWSVGIILLCFFLLWIRVRKNAIGTNQETEEKKSQKNLRTGSDDNGLNQADKDNSSSVEKQVETRGFNWVHFFFSFLGWSFIACIVVILFFAWRSGNDMRKQRQREKEKINNSACARPEKIRTSVAGVLMDNKGSVLCDESGSPKHVEVDWREIKTSVVGASLPD